MAVRRSSAFVAAVGIAAAAALAPALPAFAHGAPSNPVSRAFACGTDGDDPGPAACRAALAANGRPFGSWDNLRVPGVRGRDRQYIPDGQLCSASLPEFRGLDLPRTDWPATALAAGSVLTMRYRSTIPHKGSFRVYLTRAGYRPGLPLSWDSLDPQPFLTATDPPLREGAYTFAGRLPAERTGRHVLYTVWQTTDTPDTYYSCSDVVLGTAGAAGAAGPPDFGRGPGRPGDGGLPGGAGGPGGAPPFAVPPQPGPEPGGADVPAKPVTPAPSKPNQSPAVLAGPGEVPPPPPADGARHGVETESWLTVAEPVVAERVALGQQIMSAALIVIVGVTGGLAFLRIRAERHQGARRRPGGR
jgi:chitin-binding protein